MRLRGPLASLLGTIGALLLLETGIRITEGMGWSQAWTERQVARTDSIWTMSDAPRVYAHRPNYIKNGVRFTESHGILRPDDVAEAAGPGTFRIAGLGDSVIAAIDLPYDDRVLTVVERRLNERPGGERYEVLNFGVNGYNTEQEAAQLEQLTGTFRPQLIILQYCINDFYPSERPMGWFLDRSASRLVSVVSHAIDRGLQRGYPPARYWETLYRTDTKGWESVRQGFDHIAAWAKREGVRVLLVVFPVISHGGWFESSAETHHARVTALGHEIGFEVLDLLPVFGKYPVEDLRAKPWDTFHPNVKGHQIAAEAIVSALAHYRLIPDDRP